MHVHAYSAAGGYYLHLPRKDDFSRVPAAVLAKLGGRQSLTFSKTYELEDRSVVGLDPTAARDDITRNGYHINKVAVRSEEGA